MKRQTLFLSLALGLAMCLPTAATAGAYDGIEAAPMRRPITTDQPLWLVHIDTWNWADPDRIIDLVPEDIRPWVVMNISLSISHREEGSFGSPSVDNYVAPEFTIVEDGYQCARSWVRACAERGMWCTVQPSSGGYSHFQNKDLDIFEEFFEYPNFIGWNFCEQFWGYDNTYSCSFDQRMALFTELLKLSHKYGGYLFYSFCGPFWAGRINPVAMIRRYPAFRAALEECNDHWVCCEKYTSVHGFLDIESTCMGTWLSGYAAHYGIRYDNCGWEWYQEQNGWPYPTAIGAVPWLTHPMLTGETVWDGPELIWTQDFHEVGATTDADGYTRRNWERFPQFDNVNIDIFRKFADGTIRIPTREEVTERTKVIVLNDLNTGDDRKDYLTEQTLFDGLYKHADDGTDWNSQHNFLKATGRYPAIPTAGVLNPADSLAQTFPVQVKRSAYTTRWPNSALKVAEFKRLFPEQYTGTIFADHIDNSWALYNPFVGDRRAYGYVPFQYNTAERLHTSLAPYSLVQMTETADSLHFYLTNYRTDDASLKSDTIWVEGCAERPTVAWRDRARHAASQVTEEWLAESNQLKLTVRHNGPLDIDVAARGTATDRLTAEGPVRTPLTRPAAPPAYTGTLQHEGEVMDYRSVTRCVTNGVNGALRGYSGQGYIEFGSQARADLRDTVRVLRAGSYTLRLRYSAPDDKVQTVSIFVNGGRVVTMNLPKNKAGETWQYYERKVTLREGENAIRFGSATGGGAKLYLDTYELVPTDETGIEDVAADAAGAGPWRDLLGRPVAQPGRGIFVRDGKKVLIK